MKKLILAALALTLSTGAFANNVQDVLKSIVQMKTYYGETEHFGEDCSMTFSDVGNGILITARTENEQLSRLVRNNSAYHNIRGFLTSEVIDLGRGRKVESTFRTIYTNDGRRYMVVEEREISTDRYPERKSIACIVNI
jgi:hypothetical protein